MWECITKYVKNVKFKTITDYLFNRSRTLVNRNKILFKLIENVRSL